MREGQKGKKVILAVSFGTSYKETRDKTIGAIEEEMAAAYPDWEVRRAFTSGFILRILKKRDGLHIDNVEEAMERLAADGAETVVVQPTHIINGEEFEKMLAQISPFKGRFDQLKVGAPLLTSSADYQAVASAVIRGLSRSRAQAGDGCGGGAAGERAGRCEKECDSGYEKECGSGCDGRWAGGWDGKNREEALVLMGHGTGHHSDAAYAALDFRFKEMGWQNVFVGTVEGYPALEHVRKQVKRLGFKRVTLAPFMVVAGDHARNDMAGEEEDSWKNQFQEDGCQVECVLKGIGEFQEVRDIYVAHARQAMEE